MSNGLGRMVQIPAGSRSIIDGGTAVVTTTRFSRRGACSEAVDVGHHQVENDQVEGIRIQPADRFPAARDGLDCVTGALKRPRHHQADRLVVFTNENLAE